MGEVLPNAIPLMAKAAQDAGLSISGTVKEMLELQQKGALVSSKVLPFFAKRMSEAAQANGGLNKALESNRVAMNRMTTSAQESSDSFFKSGYSEGLTDLFNTLATSLKENSKLWKALGQIIGGALKGISMLINVVSSALRILGAVLKPITDLLGDFSGAFALVFVIPLWRAAAGAIGLMSTAMTSLGVSTNFTAAAFLKLRNAVGFLGTMAGTLGGALVGGVVMHKWAADKGLSIGGYDERNRRPTQVNLNVDGETLARSMVETNTMKSTLNSTTAQYAQ